MIVRNCEWVSETEEESKKTKKKRCVTTAMIDANRKNATKSTGPKPESLDRTRFNGVRHGMASREIMFIDGENPDEFWAEVNLWCKERGARTADERNSIVTAVYSVWVKARAINSQVHAVNQAIANINDHFFEQTEAEVRELFDDLKAKPEVVVTALMNSSSGCAFLIDQFSALRDRLTTHYCFEVSQREHALRMGGHRPKELFTDKVVAELNRSYFGSIRGPGGFTAAGVANALIYDRPDDISLGEFERRLERTILDLPTIEDGQAECQRYVNRWMAQLAERKELMGYREEKRKQAAIGQARSDVSADGQILFRYMTQSDRTYNAAMKMLLSLKADRRKYGGDDDDESEPEEAPGAELSQEENSAPEFASEPVEIEPEPAVVPAVDDEKPSEAVTTEVAASTVSYNANPPRTGITNGRLVQLSDEDIAAIQTHYRESLAKVQLGLDERAGSELS